MPVNINEMRDRMLPGLRAAVARRAISDNLYSDAFTEVFRVPVGGGVSIPRVQGSFRPLPELKGGPAFDGAGQEIKRPKKSALGRFANLMMDDEK